MEKSKIEALAALPLREAVKQDLTVPEVFVKTVKLPLSPLVVGAKAIKGCLSLVEMCKRK